MSLSPIGTYAGYASTTGMAYAHGAGCLCASCGQQLAARDAPVQTSGTESVSGVAATDQKSGGSASSNAGIGQAGKPLPADQQKQVDQLKARDQEVRQHEAAHIAASGGLARGGATYTYQRGPDGKQYAIGGEVSIDTSEGRSPEETLQKAERIRASATAPADPSPQDKSVAAAAQAMAQKAQSELTRQRQQAGEGAVSLSSPPRTGHNIDTYA